MLEIVYEDNHLIGVNKKPGELVQADQTGDEPIVEKVKKYIKKKVRQTRWCFCRSYSST